MTPEEIENEIGIIQFEMLRLARRLATLAESVRRPAELEARRERDSASIEDRCRRVMATTNKEELAGYRVETWVEIKQAFVAYQKASGKHGARLGQYNSDAGTRALVALFATGYSVEELCEAIREVIRGRWWAKLIEEGTTPDLSMLSPVVVRRAIERVSPREGRARLERQRREEDPNASPAQRVFRREPESGSGVVVAPPKSVFAALRSPNEGDDSGATNSRPPSPKQRALNR